MKSTWLKKLSATVTTISMWSFSVHAASTNLTQYCDEMNASILRVQDLTDDFKAKDDGRKLKDIEKELNQVDAKLALLNIVDDVKDNYVAFLARQRAEDFDYDLAEGLLDIDAATFNTPNHYANTGIVATSNLAGLTQTIKSIQGSQANFDMLTRCVSSDSSTDNPMTANYRRCGQPAQHVCVPLTRPTNNTIDISSLGTSQCDEKDRMHPYVAQLMSSCYSKMAATPGWGTTHHAGYRDVQSNVRGSSTKYGQWDSEQELCYRLTANTSGNASNTAAEAVNTSAHRMTMMRLISDFATSYEQSNDLGQLIARREQNPSSVTEQQVQAARTAAHSTLDTLMRRLTIGLEPRSEDLSAATIGSANGSPLHFESSRVEFDGSDPNNTWTYGNTDGINSIISRAPHQRELTETIANYSDDMEICLSRIANGGAGSFTRWLMDENVVTDNSQTTFDMPATTSIEYCEQLWNEADPNGTPPRTKSHKQLMNEAIGAFNSTFQSAEASSPMLNLAINRHQTSLTSGDVLRATSEASTVTRYTRCFQSGSESDPNCAQINRVTDYSTDNLNDQIASGISGYEQVFKRVTRKLRQFAATEQNNTQVGEALEVEPFFLPGNESDAFEQRLFTSMIGSRNIANLKEGVRRGRNISQIKQSLLSADQFDKPEDYYLKMIDELYTQFENTNCLASSPLVVAEAQGGNTSATPNAAALKRAARRIITQQKGNGRNDQKVRRLFHSCIQSMIADDSDVRRELTAQSTALKDRKRVLEAELQAINNNDAYKALNNLLGRLSVQASRICQQGDHSVRRVQCVVGRQNNTNQTMDVFISNTGDIISHLPENVDTASIRTDSLGLRATINPACNDQNFGGSERTARRVKRALGDMCSAFRTTAIMARGELGPPVPISQQQQQDEARAAYHRRYINDYQLTYDTKTRTIIHFEDRSQHLNRGLMTAVGNGLTTFAGVYVGSQIRIPQYQYQANLIDGQLALMESYPQMFLPTQFGLVSNPLASTGFAFSNTFALPSTL